MTNTGEKASKDRASHTAQPHQASFEQSIDAILSNMSHELRTPLNGIIGFSELLERRDFGPLTKRQLTYVQNIHVCGWRLLKLVNDIVDLSKIEVGKLTLSREWTSLDPLVEAALGATEVLADRKRIALSASLQPNLPKVWVDPVRMQQVFGNLLASAVEFTPEAGSAGLRAFVDQSSVCVSASETGIGIEAAEHRRVRPRIESVESPLSEQREDAGLGLALAMRLVNLHGGRIDVRIGAKGGPTFTATIPLTRQRQKVRTDAA